MLYLFDIDGTLVLTGGAGAIAIDRVFQDRFRLDGAMQGIRPGGKTDPQIVDEVFWARMGRAPTPDETAYVLTEYVTHLGDAVARSERYRVMPSVFEVLDLLDADDRVHLALATGNVRDSARIKLERADLWRRFPVGGFGDDAADRGDLVARAIERARAHAADTTFARDDIVVVGDTPRDVAAARACGVVAIAVATGSCSREQLAECEPDAVFDTLAELPAWHRARIG